MTIENISDQLVVLQSLNRKQVYELLFNIACSSKEFTKLLEATHFQYSRARFISDRVNLVANPKGLFSSRVLKVLLEATTQGFTSEEYHVLFTLVKSPHISQTIRESLRTSLGYSPVAPPVVSIKRLQHCAICAHPTDRQVCLSCIRKIKDFTEWRRYHFTVPINYLNFNIRGEINVDGEFTMHYNDWCIDKKQGNKEVVFNLLQVLEDGVFRYEPVLPIIEYQKVIV